MEQEQRRQYAWSVIEETTADLNEINKTVSDSMKEVIKDIRSWQRTLITLIFAVLGSMAPIFFATGKIPFHNRTFITGIILLLFDGVYLTNTQLRIVEKDLRDLPVSMSDLSRMLRTRLDTAREAFLDPSNEKIMAIKDAGEAIVNTSGEKLSKQALKERPSFTNDIGIGAFVLGIIFLLRGVFTPGWLFYCLIVLSVVYFVFVALKDSKDIFANKKIKLEDVENFIRSNTRKG